MGKWGGSGEAPVTRQLISVTSLSWKELPSGHHDHTSLKPLAEQGSRHPHTSWTWFSTNTLLYLFYFLLNLLNLLTLVNKSI